jgi:hypothetical protein
VGATLRRQALAWLRADLAAYAQLAAPGDPKVKEAVRQQLAHWQQDPDLASVRDQEALGTLPDEERQQWGQLWGDVAALLKKVGQERLPQGPGAGACPQAAATPQGPPTTRWTLGTLRASLDWLAYYTPRGAWRLLDRLGLRLRSARVQQFSPDPQYAAKLFDLEMALWEARRDPRSVVAVFLDKMGFSRWPAPALSGPGRRRWQTAGGPPTGCGGGSGLEVHRRIA